MSSNIGPDNSLSIDQDHHGHQGNSVVEVVRKGDVFKRINAGLALNDYQLPTHIYRSDVIPADLFQYSPADRSGILEAAALEISFNHGYPAIQEHTPMWDRLPGEPSKAFDCFLIFLELPESTNSNNPIRFLPLIAQTTQTPIDQLVEWCEVFYWHWRSRAYDLFMVACHRKQRELRIMSIEGHHFRTSEKLLKQVTDLAGAALEAQINHAAEDPEYLLDGVKVKDLIDAATKLVAIQRISVGLPSAGPAQVDIKYTGPRNADVNETLKSIAKESVSEGTQQRKSQDVDTLLQNPQDLNAIQELMIRLSSPNHVLPAWGDGKTISLESNAGDAGDASNLLSDDPLLSGSKLKEDGVDDVEVGRDA